MKLALSVKNRDYDSGIIKKRVCAEDRTTEVKTSMMLVTDFK
jgi:hypothetical protein